MAAIGGYMSTSYRVMKIHDFDNSVFYRVSCDCTDAEHDMCLEMDVDDFPIMSLHFYWNAETTVFWGDANWFKRQWHKLKLIGRLIVHGRLDLQGDFLLLGQKHIDSFIEALKEGKELLATKLETGHGRNGKTS